jgi:hypothetical protein
LRLARANNQRDPISTKKKLGTVARICHPSYEGSIKRRIVIQTGPGRNVRPYLKNKQSKMGRGWGLGGLLESMKP